VCDQGAGDFLDRSTSYGKAVEKTPEGPIEVKVKGTPKGEFFGRIEQPGERLFTT